MSTDERAPQFGAMAADARSPAAAAGEATTDDLAGRSTEELFERAVRLHTRRLLAIARAIAGNRASAEDVVQQALTNLYQHRDRYDWREPGGLMRRAVVNEALRLLRQPRMVSVDEGLPLPTASTSGYERGQASPSEPLIDRETVERVRQAIDRLPEHFRAALVLCEYEGMSYAQIAETLNASVPQIKTWIHRGRRQLGGMLKDFVGRPPKGERGD